jgi:hypothetical protein
MKFNLNDLLNENIPLYQRAMISDCYSNDYIFGKLIGKLKENFKDYQQSEIIYVIYRKEMFNYLVTIFHFDDVKVKLTPIEVKIFKEWEQMKDYVRCIQVHIGDDSYQMERKQAGVSDVFDYHSSESKNT